MEFKFTKEEEDIKKAAGDFALKGLAPHEIEKKDYLPMDVVNTMGELGFLGLKLPEQHGGVPASWVEVGLVAEAIAQGNISMAFLVMLSCQLTLILSTYGSVKAKQDWLLGISEGRNLGGVHLIEPENVSESATVSGCLSQDPGYYELSGEKCLVILGAQAEFAIVFAKIDHEGKGEGITAFLAPLDLPGIFKSPVKNMGLLPLSFAELRFDRVKIPVEYRLGQEGDGIEISARLGLSSDTFRILSGLIPLGVARQAVSHAISYAKKRMAFGRVIAKFQEISRKIAEGDTLIEMGRSLCYRALSLKDQGVSVAREAAMCSWWCPKSAYQVIEDALLIFGHAGYSDEHPFQQMLRDVIAFELIGGSEDMMKLVIARKTVGKVVIPDSIACEEIY